MRVFNLRLGKSRAANSLVLLFLVTATVFSVLPLLRYLRGHTIFDYELWYATGKHVRVRVDSFPGKDFDGVVEQINRQAEFTPRNVQTVADRIRQVFGVKIRLPNDDDRLRAGMAADVYFPNVK